jgi:dethiobiotin synthase
MQMRHVPLFIAATGQNVGKTTCCLGLVAAFRERYSSVGFIKPVGQESVEDKTGIHVDKDVLLFRSFFALDDPVEIMSPVLFPKGFTRDFLDGRVHKNELTLKIRSAYDQLYKRHPMMIIEGTGHIGVGSIVDLNNAQVAALLNVPMILVASGGLGSAFDALSINIAACEKHGVRVAGVILNRVFEEKRAMISQYMTKALERFNIPLLGCIPFDTLLSLPTMHDFELLFQTELMTGAEFRLRHFVQMRLAASPVEVHREAILPHQLIITPASREDIVLTTLTRYWDLRIAHPEDDLELGLILTGKTPPAQTLVQEIQRAKIPMLYTPLGSFAAMKMINNHTAKIREADTDKIKEAIKVVASHVDLERIEATS